MGQGACGRGLCVLACLSWPVCLGLSVLVCMSWPVCLGLSFFACVSWGCRLCVPVLKCLCEYGLCGGLTPAVSRRATHDSRMRTSYHWRGRLQCFVRPSPSRWPSAPRPRCGPPQGRWMWSGAGGVRSWPLCRGLYVVACMSWPFMSWPVCLGLYVLAFHVLAFHVLACVSWGCRLCFPVLKCLFEYGFCGGLTPAVSRRPQAPTPAWVQAAAGGGRRWVSARRGPSPVSSRSPFR